MTHGSAVHRAPRPDERALLDHLLIREARGFELLREQAVHAQVIESSFLDIKFWVPRGVAAAIDVEGRSGRVVSRAASRSTDRSTLVDTFLWLTDDGYLDEIEIEWIYDVGDRLPRPDELSEPIAP